MVTGRKGGSSFYVSCIMLTPKFYELASNAGLRDLGFLFWAYS